jgi:hypothetical protein
VAAHPKGDSHATLDQEHGHGGIASQRQGAPHNLLHECKGRVEQGYRTLARAQPLTDATRLYKYYGTVAAKGDPSTLHRSRSGIGASLPELVSKPSDALIASQTCFEVKAPTSCAK